MTEELALAIKLVDPKFETSTKDWDAMGSMFAKAREMRMQKIKAAEASICAYGDRRVEAALARIAELEAKIASVKDECADRAVTCGEKAGMNKLQLASLRATIKGAGADRCQSVPGQLEDMAYERDAAIRAEERQLPLDMITKLVSIGYWFAGSKYLALQILSRYGYSIKGAKK